MAMIMKDNARKFLAQGNMSFTMAHDGVGGMDGKPVIILQIGNHRVFLGPADIKTLQEELKFQEM